MKFVKLRLIKDKFPDLLRREKPMIAFTCHCRKTWNAVVASIEQNTWIPLADYWVVLSRKPCLCDGINEDLPRETLDSCYYWSTFSCLKRFLYSSRALFLLIKRSCGRENPHFVYFGFLAWVCAWLTNNCPDPSHELMFNWSFARKRLNFYRHNQRQA